jgi:MSHA biogenesis protein MshG
VAVFQYKGRQRNGSIIQGQIEATNLRAASEQIQAQGIIPLNIQLGKKDTPSIHFFDLAKINSLFKPRIHSQDILLFSRQISTLLKAGVPILRALKGLQDSTVNISMRDLLHDIRTSLESGRELSAGLARHPKVFSAFYLSMVRVGEMTGLLEEIFLQLYRHLEFESYMRQQVKSALRYPSFVLVALVLALVVINLFVIPSFSHAFASFGADLPLMTRILIGFSNFMIAWWPVLLGATLGGIMLWKRWLNTDTGRYKWDKFKLSLPIAGKIILKATLARFSRSFSLASRSGVPILQTLSVVSQTTDNRFIAQRIEQMRYGIERGEPLLRNASQSGVFTPMVLQMIAVGEESGTLDDMMDQIAELYQREVEYELKTLSQQIEPILIGILALIMLILALGIFLPIWDLGRASLGKAG